MTTRSREFQFGDPYPDPKAGAHDGTSAGPDAVVILDVHVPADLRYLDGHFPGQPIVPGVAQLLLVERAIRRAFPDLGPTAGLKALKFMNEVPRGVTVTVRLKRPSVDKVRFSIRHGEVELTRGALLVREPAA
jgi:3-hydroxymyristoyl/3-hydroxydecanoyl-(acyl carrier protein) dehydratase